MSDPRTTRWLVAGARVCGASHMRTGLPCQDAILWRDLNGAVVLAVADGHGSERSPYSDYGAQIAVDVAVDVLSQLSNRAASLSLLSDLAEEQLPRDLVRTWTDLVRQEHSVAGRAAPEDSNALAVQYGSTLLTVLATQEFLLFCQLGDGDILVVSDDGSVTRPVARDERLLANETTSLCTPHAWREVRTAIVPL